MAKTELEMKLQGNKIMKANFRKLAILTLFGGAMVGLTACGGGGGGSSESSDPYRPSTGRVAVSVTQKTPGLVELKVTNISSTNSSKLWFSMVDANNYYYSNIGQNLPNVCNGDDILRPSEYCYIDVYPISRTVMTGLSKLNYIDNNINLNHVVSITNSDQVFNYNFELTGALYALTDNNVIFEKDHGSPVWNSDQVKLANSTIVSALTTDFKGAVVIANAMDGHIYLQTDYATKAWDDLGKVIATTNTINTIAYDKGNTLYAAGNSNVIYRQDYTTQSWVTADNLPLTVTSINNIGFINNDWVAQVNNGSAPTFYRRSLNIWSNIGMPALADVLGFSVSTNGKIYSSLRGIARTYSYDGAWSAGDVFTPAVEAQSLFTDSHGNLFAGDGNSVYQKLVGGPWVNIGTPDGYAIKAITQGVRLTITRG